MTSQKLLLPISHQINHVSSSSDPFSETKPKHVSCICHHSTVTPPTYVCSSDLATWHSISFSWSVPKKTFRVINSFVILNPIMAFGLRTKSFGFLEGEPEFLNAFQWWNQIDDSDQWQRGTYYALCVAYTLVSFIALVRKRLNFFQFFYF